MKKNTLLANWPIYTLALFGILLLSPSAQASDPNQISKETRLSYPVNNSTHINMTASSTEVYISTWDKYEVEIIASITFKGEQNDRMDEFLENFESEVTNKISQSSQELDISAKLEIPNKVQIGSKHVGMIISYDRDELEIIYEIKVPTQNDLTVKNSYRELHLEGNYLGKVKISHYSGDLVGGNFDELELALKYGNADLQNVSRAVMDLYEQDLTVKKLGQAKIMDKYSTIEIQKSNKVTIDGYESEVRLGSINVLSGQLKYAEIQVDDSMEEVSFSSIYESKFLIKESQLFAVDMSKYSRVRANAINELVLPDSYEDEVEVGFVNTVRVNSKYLKMDIDKIGRELKADMYEGEIRANELSESCESISLDGKYIDFTLRDSNRNLSIDADVQYGTIDYDDSRIKQMIYIKEGSTLQMKAESIDNQGLKTNITLRGYEVKASLH